MICRRASVIVLRHIFISASHVPQSLFNPLRLDADVPLCDGGGAVLQEPLDQGNVIAVRIVNLCCVPLAEAVGADALITQIVTDDGKLLLDCPFRNRKHAVIPLNAVPQTVVFNVLLNDQRDGEDAALACLLLGDLQAVAVPIQNDVAGAEAQNVADAQAQVPFQHKGGGNALIGAAAAEAIFHGRDDFLVLLCGQGGCFLVHGFLQQ